MRVGVYGTLKEWFGNHWVMKSAEGKLLFNDHVEVSSLHNVWYPCVKFKQWSKQWLNVEVYEVPDRWLQHLDWLEWYEEWSDHNLYNRITVPTQNNWDVLIYEIVSDIPNDLWDYWTHQDRDWEDYYDWN